VDNLLIKSRVGVVQRAEIKRWRGFPKGRFGYNEIPTSSCHTFCWKARHSFDVPFFYLQHGAAAPFGIASRCRRVLNPRCRSDARDAFIVALARA